MFRFFSNIHIATKAEVIVKNDFKFHVTWKGRRRIRELAKTKNTSTQYRLTGNDDSNEYDIAILYVIEILDDLPKEERYERIVKESIEVARKLMDYAINRAFIKIIMNDIERKRISHEILNQTQKTIGEKECPMCAEFIKPNAVVCRYCHYDLQNEKFI